jgi:hypothetical protein
MKCECGAFSTILVENEDGTVTPKCDQCYYNPQFAEGEMKTDEAIQEYQCSGCVNGPYPECYQRASGSDGVQCGKHCPGTFVSARGKIFLGLPVGFDRLGPYNDMRLLIFQELKNGWGEYDKFNVPVWKHLDEHGNTLVRGISPRLNMPFLHIFLLNVIDKIECREITAEDIEGMD